MLAPDRHRLPALCTWSRRDGLSRGLAVLRGSGRTDCRRDRSAVAVMVIPQKELRNNVADVLRRAEAGEQFTITVAGRPVAERRRAIHTSLATRRSSISPERRSERRIGVSVMRSLRSASRNHAKEVRLLTRAARSGDAA